MVRNHPRSRFRTPAVLVALRWVLGWQALGYEDWLCCVVAPASNVRPGEFVFFACYVLAGLMPPVSPFPLTVLEFYGVQL
jgi:hypothetical protein